MMETRAKWRHANKQKSVAKKAVTFSRKGFFHSLQQMYRSDSKLVVAVQKKGRVIAREREFSNGNYTSWKCIHASDATENNEWTCVLPRGGTLTMNLNRINTEQCLALKEEIENCKQIKSYNGPGLHREPRVHALASNNGGGYRYNSTMMKAFPLNEVPVVQQFAQTLAEEHGIDDWNIGVDLLVYRSQDDSIGWHSDDTQEETIIVAAVVHVGEQIRSLCVTTNCAPIEGDKQVEIYAGAGDTYQMDGTFQSDLSYRPRPYISDCPKSQNAAELFSCHIQGKQQEI